MWARIPDKKGFLVEPTAQIWASLPTATKTPPAGKKGNWGERDRNGDSSTEKETGHQTLAVSKSKRTEKDWG